MLLHRRLVAPAVSATDWTPVGRVSEYAVACCANSTLFAWWTHILCTVVAWPAGNTAGHRKGFQKVRGT